jgi:hypothetical protein
MDDLECTAESRCSCKPHPAQEPCTLGGKPLANV